MANRSAFGSAVAISELCLLVEDIDRSIEFYGGKVGFELRRRHDHFADFWSPGITLALWRADHFFQTASVEERLRGKVGNRALIAVQLANVSEVDGCYASLRKRGVAFTAAPVELPWNARGAYFADPLGTFWEIYAYRDGAAPD